MRTPHRTRRGFTLIELLIVIAVIAILATVMLPMVNSAMNSQRRGKAAGEIAALMAGCERYRKLYGDFPCARTGTATTISADQPNYRRDLFLQLTGKQRLSSTQLAGGGVSIALVDVTSVRPIVTVETVPAVTKTGTTPTDLTLCEEFVDPWGNAYDYRYRILSAAGVATSTATAGNYSFWLSPDCLIVSCGANFIEGKIAATPHVPLPAEYWDLAATASQPTRGTIPATYYEDVAGSYFRSDNVTSWSGR